MQQDLFVGRVNELSLLTSSLVECSSGRGRFVAVSGEPAIGKTRLVNVFAEGARKLGCRR